MQGLSVQWIQTSSQVWYVNHFDLFLGQLSISVTLALVG